MTAPSDAPTTDLAVPQNVGTVGTAGTAQSPPSLRDDDPAERGRLDVGFTVVRRIAEHVADTADATQRTRRRVLGVGREESATAKVSGYGDSVDMRLEVPLVYPTPIGPAVDAVRSAVRERVETLTGYSVRSLDVTVSALTVPAGPPAPTARAV